MAFKHLPGHLAGGEFPNTEEGLSVYDVVILSDIGANTLLLHPDTWIHGRPTPNRLRPLREWVTRGGGLIMCGGLLLLCWDLRRRPLPPHANRGRLARGHLAVR